ncbi:3-dehydroquinate synthase [Candidatus Woesearchaeota archaeon B3_Woes]|nr:MAG: 3-dehydroquinate synthase [Candidatus Woesearchaeota archaeon B3_Woes]
MVESKDNVMRINLKREIDESYNLVFGNELFPQIASDLKDKPIGSRYAIVTDSNVRELYEESLEDALRSEGIETQIFSFEAGEQNKTIDSCMTMMGEMSHHTYGRDSAILALGGGVVGDMAGFMATIFNRGIPYIQIPTTVLAQADSSIGGKTAVDTEYGKNLVGAFKQPERVYIDVATLKTLSEEDYRNGLAETIKHGVIQDAEFFNYLQENVGLVLERSSESSLYIAKNNCGIKGNVVEVDPHEKGLRKILNYGHTVGHAVEKLSNFELSHGEAVAIGMMVAGRIANRLGYFSQKDLQAQEALLVAVGLPITIPNGISNENIIDVTSRDKKAKDGKARYVLPISIGQMHEFNGTYATHVDNDVVMNVLQRTR